VRPVQRQLDPVRQARQHAPPVVQLRGQHTVRVVFAAEQFLLPQRVVRVLHRQWCPLWSLVGLSGGVGGGDVLPQRGHRPAVGGDVVEHQGQHVFPRAQAQQLRPHRHVPFQVKRSAHQPGENLVELARRDVSDAQAHPGVVEDVLIRHAVVLREPGPQRLVPTDHIGQCGVQCLDVHSTFEPHDQRHVVGGGRALQVVQEPEPPLGAGQRDQRRPLPPGQSGPRD